MKDFRTYEFLLYLNETFYGYGNHSHASEIVENICHFALNKFSAEPEEFIAFLRELLPEEIEDDEIKRFIIA